MVLFWTVDGFQLIMTDVKTQPMCTLTFRLIQILVLDLDLVLHNHKYMVDG